MSKPKMIKPIDGFANVSDADILARGTNVQTSMNSNANFPTPPVDLATLKAALDAFSVGEYLEVRSASVSHRLNGFNRLLFR